MWTTKCRELRYNTLMINRSLNSLNMYSSPRSYRSWFTGFFPSYFSHFALNSLNLSKASDSDASGTLNRISSNIRGNHKLLKNTPSTKIGRITHTPMCTSSNGFWVLYLLALKVLPVISPSRKDSQVGVGFFPNSPETHS